MEISIGNKGSKLVSELYLLLAIYNLTFNRNRCYLILIVFQYLYNYSSELEFSTCKCKSVFPHVNYRILNREKRVYNLILLNIGFNIESQLGLLAGEFSFPYLDYLDSDIQK